jgi:D-glycero-D-manno-heptose 1,7-bisphosphate phosphatase
MKALPAQPAGARPRPPDPGRRAVFLDRDGVINRLVYNPDLGLVDSPQNPDQFELLPGVAEAIRQLNQLGLLAVVVSNQPGVAKGKCTLSCLEAMTAKMHQELAAAGAHLDGVYYCLHHPEALLGEYRVACHCRKPRPGLLYEAAAEHRIDLRSSFLVGDGITDIQAGRAAQCTTVFLGNFKCDVCQIMAERQARPDFVVRSLAEAAKLIHTVVVGEQWEPLPQGEERCPSFLTLPT